MATTYKVLGQVLAPSAGAYATLYNPSTQAVVSTIVVSNQGTTGATYNIAVAASATSPTAPDATLMCYSVYVAPNTTTSYTMGVTVESGKYIRVAASSTNVAFQAYGSEIG